MLYTNAILIEPSQVILSITGTILCSLTCPVDCFPNIFFNPDIVVIKVSNLKLSNGISLLGKNQMSIKVFLYCCVLKYFSIRSLQISSSIQYENLACLGAIFESEGAKKIGGAKISREGC